MESIRPDDDELRAEPPIGGAEPRKPDGQKSKSASNRQKPPKPEKTSGGGGPGGGLLMWLVLVVVAAGAGAGWYVQNERIEALEGQLEEADYWARQSKLALARFEGELSETGESLQERGASLEEKIAANDKRLDSADSEIRKLWVIANERNKKRLDEHQQRLADVDDQLAQANKAVADLSASLEQARTGLSADVAQVRQRLDDSVASLERANQEATQQLTRLSQQIGDVDQVIESRIRRFEQEQKLGISGMEGQVAALEQKMGSMAGDDEVRALRNQLSELKKTVDAVDASRSQLTSRLVRLSEEVNQLRSQVSGN
jgi:chromosome segregation ATPase